MKINGVYPPIITPFGADGALDVAALKANITRWNSTGLRGYVVAGSNGESVLLTDDEVARAVAAVREAALPDQVVIAGTARESTAGTIALSKAAAAAGAHIALVMTPSFFGGEMNAAAMQAHYRAVADASPIPVMLYNVPKFTHLNLDVASVVALSSHENIIGIKDSAGDIGQLINILRQVPKEFVVFCGNAPAFLSAMQVGGAGGILALANVAPRECVAIYDHVQRGELEAAREIQFRMMPVGAAVTSRFGVPGLKAAMEMVGYHGGAPRPPLMPADEATRATMKQILTTAGLL
jgi:4-hydroxy-2-oxoglutarate aldolase